jgi:predicted nucleic acid-binding protein
VTAFVDTAVIMYANGVDHPLRAPSRQVMQAVVVGELDGVTSSEVIQEILHRFISIRRPEVGARIAMLSMDAFAPVLPITHELMRRVPDLTLKYPNLAARDLVHVATCIHEGITEIISPDRGFDQVAEVRRIDLAAFAAHHA